MASVGDRFEADVRIGKGLRPIAQHGRLTIENGRVTLFDSHGGQVAEAAVHDVTATKLTFPLHGLRLTLAGDGYNLDATTTRWQTITVGRIMAGASRKTTTFTQACIAYLDHLKSSPS